jgi:hypothetical protein
MKLNLEVSRIFVYCFASRPRIFHSYGYVIIADEGLRNLCLRPALRAFEQAWDLHRAIPAVTRGLDFSGLIRSTGVKPVWIQNTSYTIYEVFLIKTGLTL